MNQAAIGYLAPEGFVPQLREELAASGPLGAESGRLLLAPGPLRPAAWAANVWLKPEQLPIASIGDAARRLRAIQRNWALYSAAHHRRASLIQERLPHVSARPLEFPQPPPAAPLGSWTLLEPGLVLASAACSSPFVHGEVRFVEDHDAPPNRAYRKLWEALTRLGRRPGPGDHCLDLGSSPGGWTWVLAGLGARVTSVDKAALDPSIAALPGVEHLQVSAFSLDPAALGPIDWLCCDIACYPERLLRLVRLWLEAGSCRQFVCTLKFQGETDHATARAFAAIPGSRLLHLHHNKHELTWLYPFDDVAG